MNRESSTPIFQLDTLVQKSEFHNWFVIKFKELIPQRRSQTLSLHTPTGAATPRHTGKYMSSNNASLRLQPDDVDLHRTEQTQHEMNEWCVQHSKSQ